MVGNYYTRVFYLSSDMVVDECVDVESHSVQYTYSGNIVYYFIRCSDQIHEIVFSNIKIDNVISLQLLQAGHCSVEIELYRTCRFLFWGDSTMPNVLRNIQLVKYLKVELFMIELATLLWMFSSPVIMICTFHLTCSQDSVVLWMWKKLGNKSTNASGEKFIFLSGEHLTKLDIPVIFDVYNQHMMGMTIADQYWTCFDIQLQSRGDWYPLVYWSEEMALINSLIIN